MTHGRRTGLRWGIILAVLPALLTSGCLVGGDSGLPSKQPTTAPTSAPVASPSSRASGRWSCWAGSPSFGPRAATPKALWFSDWFGGSIWRYDLQTRKTEVFSMLDGLPLEQGLLERMVTASSEQCAIMIRRNYSKGFVFLWGPENGWRALPLLPQGNYVRDIAFDLNGRLLALHAVHDGCAISRFDDGKWVHISTAPDSDALVPLADGVVVTKLGRGQEMSATFVPSAAPDKAKSAKLSRVNCGHFLYYHLGGKTLCLPTNTGQRIMGANEGFELTPEGFRKCLTGRFLGFDLKAGGFLTCKVLEATDDHILVKPDIPDAPEIRLSFDSCRRFHPFRDPMGHIWVGDKRWDGREWRTIAGGWSFPGPVYRANERDYARLSDDGSRWSLVNPDIPWGAFIRNSADSTYWTTTSYSGKGKLRLIRVTGGKREVVRSIPFAAYSGTPSCRTSDGDWWWGCYGQRGIVRLTAKGTKEYPSKVHRLILSPRGHLWCNTEGNEYTRYDPGRDAFIPDKPWDDFSFDFGKWKLSYIPSINGSALWRKTDAGWAPFRMPFSPNNVQVRCNPVYRDRLLVSAGDIGVLEYNAMLRQWARLTDTFYRASFDERGRRILAGNGVLVYDGDPWTAFKPDADDEPVFQRLLKQMDDDEWKVRDEATRAMAKDIHKFLNRIVEAADDRSLSLEVRARLKTILPAEGTCLPAPPALFRTMHPVLPPP